MATICTSLDINLAVSFGPITVFRMRIRLRTWRDGTRRHRDETNDTGGFSASAQSDGQGLEVTNEEKTFIGSFPQATESAISNRRNFSSTAGIINVQVTKPRRARRATVRASVREYGMTERSEAEALVFAADGMAQRSSGRAGPMSIITSKTSTASVQRLRCNERYCLDHSASSARRAGAA